MPDTVCQQALDRVLTYLDQAGVVLSDDVCRRALNLVDAALLEARTCGGDVLQAAMDRLPGYFDLPQPAAPTPWPPLARGSIGYRHD